MNSSGQPLRRVLSRVQSSFYVCRQCRSQLQPSRITTYRGYASKDNLPLTEKIRRKIWGTDNPPGLADPYGGPSILEKRRMRREAARRAAAGIEEPELSHEHDSQIEQELDYAPVRPKQSQAASKPYVEAETWDGLEHIGHLGDWRDLPPEPQDDYVSWFNSTSKIASGRRELLSCLHQAIVECLTCQQSNIDPTYILYFNSQEVDSQVYANAKIVSAENLSDVHFSSQAEQEQLAGLLNAVANAIDADVEDHVSQEVEAHPQVQDQLTADNIQETPVALEEESDVLEGGNHQSPALEIGIAHYDVVDETFLGAKVNLQDPTTFIILKRFAQLSGHRIPDHVLSSAAAGNKPLSYLLDQICNNARPKPQKLAEVLMSKPALAGQRNVWVLPRRETSVDKEKEIGRWKVIEQELRDRGLPVLGKLPA